MDEKKVETPKKTAKEKVLELSKENEALKLENELLKQEVSKVKDSWLRTAADFENFKKRNSETRINAYKEGKIDVIKKLLVIGDNLDRALMMKLDDKTIEGLKLTKRQYDEALASEGVTPIDPLGEVFDPNTQEAVMKVPKEEGETAGTVKQVFLKGYKLGEKVIRYAQVVVIGE
ncbi:MAG: nucleotide exchange factor GrpE [Clostridia bacterium]|nr:nucleotide exchange factor GrpE [Clostridia bacterium]